MKKVIIISVTIVICFVALFWITIETNPEIATRLGFASGPGKPIEVTPDAPNAMVPSIVYEGNLYRTTGKQIPAEVDDSAIVGYISSVVPLSQLPSNEGEANFGEVGDPYAITSDGLLVIMGREWILFELAESQYDKSGSNLGVSTSVLHATVLEVHDGYFLVEPMEGSWELSSASRIEVPMKTIEPSPEPQVGVLLEIEYDGQLLETYPARISNPYSIKVIEEAESWDRIPMVMVNGTLYLDTGRESTVMARCGMMDGEITSQVPGNVEPIVDDQSNFGTGYGYQYGAIEGTIEINMNGKWWIFATEEARKGIQFPEDRDKDTLTDYNVDRTLTQEEIGTINAAFDPIIYDKQGNPMSTNIWSCFFTSYYDDIRDMDFAEFLMYYPSDGSTVDRHEFDALRNQEDFWFKNAESLDNMPVPVHKLSARIVELTLKEYAGITLKDLDTSKVDYLAEYDAFYNYTSDYAPGIFQCTRGEIDGDLVRLYEETDNGTDILTLRQDGDRYLIVAHQQFIN